MENINRSIECSVDECRHHCKNCGYCSLDRIRIGAHERSASTDRCTDCLSFSESYR